MLTAFYFRQEIFVMFREALGMDRAAVDSVREPHVLKTTARRTESTLPESFPSSR
jgi:hypothetical protein